MPGSHALPVAAMGRQHIPHRALYKNSVPKAGHEQFQTTEQQARRVGRGRGELSVIAGYGMSFNMHKAVEAYNAQVQVVGSLPSEHKYNVNNNNDTVSSC